MHPAPNRVHRQKPRGYLGAAIKRQEPVMKIAHLVKRFGREEEGVTAIEYGLIAALIAIGIIASVRIIGTSLDAVFVAISAAL
jgi:pilus assembly protein Flp/PilA